MAYDKEKVYNDVISAINIFKLKHFEYVQAYVEPSMPTLYELFPLESYELNTIKAALEKNKINAKTKMVDKWQDSENPTLQIAAFKLIATDEERKALSTNWNENNNNNLTPISVVIERTYETKLPTNQGD